MHECRIVIRWIVLATILTLFVGDLLLPSNAHARRLGWRLRCRAMSLCETTCKATSAAAQRKAGNEQAARQLIEQLASPNKPPQIIHGRVGDPDRLEVPPEFDRRAQARIYSTIEKLGSIGVDAIGPLIDHLQDDRYSISDEFDYYWRNMSVGNVCFKILRGYLEVYHDEIGYNDAHEYWSMSYCMQMRFGDTDQSAKRWWASHNHMSLVQLQIEATEWAMDRLVSRDSDDPEQAQLDRESLAAFLDKLRKSGEPIAWETGSLFHGQLTE